MSSEDAVQTLGRHIGHGVRAFYVVPHGSAFGSHSVTVMLAAAAAALGVAVTLLVVRMAIGPSNLDRVVAFEGMVAVFISAVVLYAGWTEDGHVIPILLVISSVGFVGAVSFAHYASQVDDIDSSANDAAAGQDDDR